MSNDTIQKNKLQEIGEVDANPIGLSQDVTGQINPVLDKLVSSMFVLYHQYQKHHWIVEGPQFRDLHLYLEESYNQIHAQLDNIAERMTVLGGLPTSNPVEQAKVSFVQHEAEGHFPIRQSLNKNLEDEKTLAIELRKAIRLALSMEDYGTKKLLEGVLEMTEDRAHHLDHYVSEDGLDRR